MGSLMQMLPGMGKMMKGVDEGAAERELGHIEAMILSMTPQERRDPTLINGSRRKRIARGSGTSVEELNRMLQQFASMRKIMRKLTKMGPSALRGMPGFGNLGGMLGMQRPKE